jgi:hypothetical protein
MVRLREKKPSLSQHEECINRIYCQALVLQVVEYPAASERLGLGKTWEKSVQLFELARASIPES